MKEFVFLNTIDDMVVICSLEGKLLFYNKALKDKLGYSDEEISKMHALDFHPKELRAEAELIFSDMLEGKRTHCPLPLITGDGSRIAAETRIWIGEWEGQPAMFVTIKDVSALTKQLEFGQILLEQSSALINAKESRIDQVIDEALKTMGEFAGADRTYVFRFVSGSAMTNTHEWCAPGVAAQKEMLVDLPVSIFPEWVKTLQGNREIYIPDVGKLPPSWGEEKAILELQQVASLVVLPIFSEGRLMGFVGFDFCSSQKMLNQEARELLKFFSNNLAAVWTKFEQNRQLAETARRAEELAKEANLANRSKDTFLANISHEIRTPLNAIIGIAHIMEQTRLSAVHARYLNIILSSAHTMLEIIGDILDLAKIESGKLILERIPFSIHDVIGRSVKIFEYQAAYKNIELLVSIDPEIPAVLYGDPSHIGQVLNNLLSNGVKFSDSGTITVDCAIGKWHESENKIRLEISVSDQGRGIASEDLPKLFHEFWQVGSGEAAGKKGPGLGLSISRKLTEQMGGNIKAKSKIGKGSTFTFGIPLDFADPSPAYEAEKAAAGGYSFLILDENKKSRSYTSKTLEAYGVQFRLVSGVPELLKHLSKESRYDAVLIDLHLKGTEGYSVVSRIAGQGVFKGRIFMLSTSFELMKLSGGESDIIEGFLPKPLTAKVFFEELIKGYFTEKAGAFYPDSARVFSDARVLVAEDIEINQEIVGALLAGWGIEFDLVSNGHKTVEAMSQTRYDAVLLDIHMSGMDGLEAAKAIRNGTDEWNQEVPLIGMSANAILEYDKLYQEGILSDHVLKPIDPNELLKKLVKWIPDKTRTLTDQTASGEQNYESADILNVPLGIKTVGGSSETYQRLLEKYADLYKTAGDEIAQMIRRDNYKEALDRLHSLKSPTGSIGGGNAFSAIEKLEEELRSGQGKDSVNEKVYIFMMAHGKLIREIRRYLAGRGSSPLPKEPVNPRVRQEGTDGLLALRTALSNFDPISVQASLAALRRAELGEADTIRIKLAKKAIAGYRYKTALRILKGVK